MSRYSGPFPGPKYRSHKDSNGFKGIARRLKIRRAEEALERSQPDYVKGTWKSVPFTKDDV